MTDRELLEAAAKAYGVTLNQWPDEDFLRADHAPLGQCWNPKWNPLTDDGDALRLAVKIGEPFVVRTRCVTTMGGLMEDFNPDIPGDDLRATRRAIVRAAAAMVAR